MVIFQFVFGKSLINSRVGFLATASCSDAEQQILFLNEGLNVSESFTEKVSSNKSEAIELQAIQRLNSFCRNVKERSVGLHTVYNTNND